MNHEWDPYLKFGQKTVFFKGDTLFLQGEEGSGVYFLENGKMSILLLSEDGKERIVDYLLEKSFLGATGIYGQPYPTSAKCKTDVILYYYPTKIFNSICEKHPDAKKVFIKSVSNQIKLLTETVAIMDKSYEKQMAHFLVQLYNKHNNLSVPITQVSLAQYMGTSRITVYKIIQKWSKDGIVSQGKNQIDILDLNKIKLLL
ncbi:Crp/Fnr family transcriptional regulator [Cytobacillus sp. FSL R5-0569]|uniref:Crp/Fnr family transcriptional regulator n=1 Tax=Cytobacillus TaxID=2675230 RepID=UPI0027D918FB|nr:Crp/Fnr family transcriptional regulator [Cytobacillus kochii]